LSYDHFKQICGATDKITSEQFLLELDRCISTPIYISRYDDVADVSYQQNSADKYRQYLLIKVLRCCSASSVRKPKLLFRLWPWL